MKRGYVFGLFLGVLLVASLGVYGCGEDKMSCSDVVVVRFENFVRDSCMVDPDMVPYSLMECKQDIDCPKELKGLVDHEKISEEEANCICNGYTSCIEGIKQCTEYGHVDPDDLYY